MKTHRYASSMACIAMLLSGMITPAVAAVYKVEPLEPVAGDQGFTVPSDINVYGAVAGDSSHGEYSLRSVYWDSTGQLFNLTPGDTRNTNTAGITDDGTVIYAELDRFYSSNGVTTIDLGAGYPSAVNGKGQLVGRFSGTFGIWTNGTVTPLPTPLSTTNSYANDLNNNAVAVGAAYFPDTKSYRAIIWKNGTAQEIGTLPGDIGSIAYAVNDLNQTVGYSISSTGNWRAFVWENGVIRDLGFPADSRSYAYGINNSGQIVGGFFIPNTPYGRAFIWENGVIRDLAAVLGAGNCAAYDINNAGQMTAACTNFDYTYLRPFRLTPVAAAVDLSTSLRATPLPAIVGLPLTYTTTVTNLGNITANNATLMQTLPATGFTNTSLISTKGSCSGTSNITCTFGNLATGESVVITTTTTPLSTGSITAYYSSNAVVTSSNSDINPGNNTAKIIFTVVENNAAISIYSVNSQATATRGGTITYTWSISNRGPLNARNVTLNDTLPNGLSLLSAKTTAGTCSGTVTITCALGDLRGSATVTITAKANVRGTFINTATVTSATPDSYTGDNSATVTTKVR